MRTFRRPTIASSAVETGAYRWETSLRIRVGLAHKGASRGERGHPTSTAAFDFRREADVCASPVRPVEISFTNVLGRVRADDKTAKEYNLEGGATLHLVLALRGGL